MGLYPGIRTGVKVAVVDATGKVLTTDVVYPHQPKNQWDQSIAVLARLISQHQGTRQASATVPDPEKPTS